MGLIICMLIGMFIGWLVAALKEVDEGILLRMGLGLAGGAMGNMAASFLSGSAAMGHFTLIGSVSSVIGALVVLGIGRLSTYDSRDSNTAQ